MDKLAGNVNQKNCVLQETGQYLTLPNHHKLNSPRGGSPSSVLNGDSNANYCIGSGLTASAEELQALKKKLSDELEGSSDGGSPPVYADCIPDGIMERGLWESKLDFVFGCISYAVGLGNVWRFPYLCYENGGGAFLIPWLLSIFLMGIPMFVLEVSLGQFLNTGGICIWNLVPMFKGIGYASMMMIALCNLYYIILIAWTIYYFVISFQYDLPWMHCWDNNKFCVDKNWPNLSEVLIARNLTLDDRRILTPVKNYWENQVLQLTDGIEDMGGIRWPLLLCLFVAWLMVYLVIWRGLHKSGKIIWFSACFPYVILFILFVRGITLEGATYGLNYLFTPDWSKLSESKVWISAATQVLFSYGIGIGTNIALGSYNRYHHNFYRDSIIACGISSGTSLFSAIVIFSVLGHMAYTENIEISKVAQSGPGLAFIAFPEVVVRLPCAPIWAILFFLMLIILGTDSQFCTVEAFVTGIVDEYARYLRPRRKLFTLVVCLVSFALGIPMVFQGGVYVFTLMDYFSASGFTLMTVVFCEIAGLCWIYGANRIFSQMKDMLGFSPSRYMYFCWTFISPLIIIVLFVFSIVKYERVTYANSYIFPLFGELIGWCMGMASVICIPIYALFYLLRQDGSLKERIIKGFTSVVPPRKETETAYIDIDDISAMDIVVKDIQLKKEADPEKCNG